MATASNSEILAALNLLRDVSKQALEGYREDVLFVSERLRMIVQEPSSRDNHLGHDTVSPPAGQAERDHILELIRVLEKQSEKIEKGLSQPIPSPTEWIDEDPRVVDTKIDSSQSSPGTKIRKGLGQRSLASEYNIWEVNIYNTSRVTSLVADPSISGCRSNGRIQEYLDIKKDWFKDQTAARLAIEHGIKLLVFESLCGINGISAILFFRYDRFRRIRYTDLSRFKDAIINCERINELARTHCIWLDDCQAQYNIRCEEYCQLRNSKPNKNLITPPTVSPTDDPHSQTSCMVENGAMLRSVDATFQHSSSSAYGSNSAGGVDQLIAAVNFTEQQSQGNPVTSYFSNQLFSTNNSQVVPVAATVSEGMDLDFDDDPASFRTNMLHSDGNFGLGNKPGASGTQVLCSNSRFCVQATADGLHTDVRASIISGQTEPFDYDDDPALYNQDPAIYSQNALNQFNPGMFASRSNQDGAFDCNNITTSVSQSLSQEGPGVRLSHPLDFPDDPASLRAVGWA